MPPTTRSRLDEVVIRARRAAEAAGELPEMGPAGTPLPERIHLGGWLNDMVRSGDWAKMMTEVTAEDPELSDHPRAG